MSPNFQSLVFYVVIPTTSTSFRGNLVVILSIKRPPAKACFSIADRKDPVAVNLLDALLSKQAGASLSERAAG